MPYIRDKPSSELDTLISRKELAEQLNVHVCTLDRWVRERKGPPPTKLGNNVLYRVASVNEWLRQVERQNACVNTQSNKEGIPS